MAGPRRLRYGGVRDQILGVQVALADGTIARGGGKVVKNVAGYDLPKLFTGALGTLGVVLSASFRLYPLPADSRTLLCAAPEPEPLFDAVRAITSSTLTPVAIDVLGPDGEGQPCRLAVRFQSRVERSGAEQIATLRTLLGTLADDADVLSGPAEAEFWQTLDSVEHPNAQASWLDVRAALLPGELAGWLVALQSAATEHALALHWRAHAGHGAIRAHLAGQPEALVDTVQALRQAAEVARGALVVEEYAPTLAGRIDPGAHPPRSI